MLVGITCDIRNEYLAMGYGEEETAEFDKEDTVEAIEETLTELGFETERIGHIKNLTGRLVKGDRWDIVFNIAEGLRGIGREAQVPALLDAYDIPYVFSDPMVLSLTLHKGMTKHVIKNLRIPTPDFYVIENQSDLEHVNLCYPIFVKPVAEGTGKGINSRSKVNNRRELNSICPELLEKFHQPVLLETFLPGREFTVGIVGTGKEAVSLGVIEIILKKKSDENSYGYTNKENYIDLVEYRLVDDFMAEKAKEVALAAWRGLGCRDGGRVDLRTDVTGVPNFIEVNPLAGLHPVNSDLPILCNMKGISYKELLGRIMLSALNRAGFSAPLKLQNFISPQLAQLKPPEVIPAHISQETTLSI